ncbi:MAG TPA: DUF721 domain-containing protein [Acidimicrobiales bacterium]|nr:DUF721 domain-containing protein [Acidimicrobiales bacterium]
MSASLDRVVRTLGGEEVAILAAVARHWEAVVGPGLASHARPCAVREGAVVVEVDHPTWATHVRWLAPQVLARLGEASGQEVPDRVEVRIRRR